MGLPLAFTIFGQCSEGSGPCPTYKGTSWHSGRVRAGGRSRAPGPQTHGKSPACSQVPRPPSSQRGGEWAGQVWPQRRKPQHSWRAAQTQLPWPGREPPSSRACPSPEELLCLPLSALEGSREQLRPADLLPRSKWPRSATVVPNAEVSVVPASAEPGRGGAACAGPLPASSVSPRTSWPCWGSSPGLVHAQQRNRAHAALRWHPPLIPAPRDCQEGHLSPGV